jgi:hypothetical protein
MRLSEYAAALFDPDAAATLAPPGAHGSSSVRSLVFPSTDLEVKHAG